MKKFAIIFHFFVFNNLLFANDCFESKIKIIFEGKPEIENITICQKKTSDMMIFYISKSCLNDECDILKRTPQNLIIKDYSGNIGSPGFKLCKGLGGIPQIFEFEQNKKWQSASRCIFGRKDFIEISLLTRRWKGLINKSNKP